MLLKKSLLVAALLAASAIGTTAAATVATGNFTVSLKINSTCSVTTNAASNITLAAVNAGATTAALPGTFKVNCSNKTPFNVGLAPSNNSSTGIGALAGTAGNTATIAYALYQDAGGATPWGNTATSSAKGNGESGTGAGMAGASAQTFTVYANATGSTDVQPDTSTAAT